MSTFDGYHSSTATAQAAMTTAAIRYPTEIASVNAVLGLRTFGVPLPLPPLEISLARHPRYEADGAHAWLRDRGREVFTAPPPARPAGG